MASGRPLNQAEQVGGGGSQSSLLLRAQRAHAQRAAEAAIARKLVQVTVGAPDSTSSAEKVTLQKDFLNIVGSAPVGGVEIQIVRDADGGLRFYLP